MEIGKPHLFIEINDDNFIFLVIKYDEDFNFKVLHSTSAKSEGVSDGKIINVEISSKISEGSIKLYLLNLLTQKYL